MNIEQVKIFCCEDPILQDASRINTAQERLALIKECYDQDQFTPYRQDLAHPITPYRATTWWDCLQGYANSDRAPQRTDLHFLCCYIFASSLNNSPEKYSEVATALQELSPAELQEFLQKLLTLPPLMGAYILRMTPDHIWGSIFYKAQANFSVIINWIEAAIQYFPSEEALSFVRIIFRSYSSEDFFKCYHTESSSRTKEYITKALTPIENRNSMLIKDALDRSMRNFFLQTKKGQTGCLPRSIYEKRYILQQVAFRLNEEQVQSLLPILSSSDWQWFYHQIPPERLQDLPDVLINCAINIRSIQGNLDFLYRVVDVLPENSLLTVCRLLASNDFFSELSSRLIAFHHKCIPYFAEHAPHLLSAWIEHFLNTANPMEISSGISLFLQPLIKTNTLGSFLPSLFANHDCHPTYALTVYAALPSHVRKILLKYLVKHNQKILMDWAVMLISSSATASLSPFVRHSSLQDLYVLLNSIDPSLPCKIKEHVQAHSPLETRVLIDLYLPTDIDLNNPQEHQKICLQKCIRYFSDPLIEQYGRYAWTQDILRPFSENLPAASWIEALLENISEERWPMLFRLFHFEITDTFRSQKNTRTDIWIKRVSSTLQQISRLTLPAEEKRKYMIELLASIPIYYFKDLMLLIEHLKNPPELFLPCLSLLYSYYAQNNNIQHWENFSNALKRLPPALLIESLLFRPASEKSNLEQFLWNEIIKKWKTEIPDRGLFYTLIQRINDLENASGTLKQNLLNQVCETYIQVGCDALTYLKNRQDLLQSIKSWYPCEQTAELASFSLISIGMLDLLQPDLLTSSLERKIRTWDFCTLESLFEILEELDLVEKHLSRSSRSFLSKLFNIDPLAYPALRRACAHLRAQKTLAKSCIVS